VNIGFKDIMPRIYFIIILFAVFAIDGYSQNYDITPNKTKKIITWSALQLIPSSVLVNDADENNARVQFAFRWQFIPLNISFNPNKYVSPVQFFIINPVRKVTGSAEVFVQPEYSLANFKYSGAERPALSTGARVIIPVQEMGENISMSVGGKYTFRKNERYNEYGYPGVEAGVYFFGGLFGLQFAKDFSNYNKYSISFYLKYY